MSSSIRKRKTSGNHNSHNSSFEQSSITMTQEGYYVQEGEYNVEKILEMKEEKGITYYRVKWEGYPESESTWEPISHLQNVLDLIEDFQIELTKKDSLKDFQEIKQVPYFEPIRRFETDFESQEHKGLFEDDSVFRKRRMEEREDRDIREKVLGMEYFGESMNRLNYEEVDLFKAKVVVKKEKMEVESNLSKKDKDIEREKRRERGSQLRREDVKQGKESINQKEDSQRKIEFKSEHGVYQRKSEVTPIRQEKMLIEEIENSEEKKSVKVKTSKKNVGEGSYKLKDKPKQILTIKEKKKGGFWFLVEWQRRKDGTKPENSYVENEEMKQNDPYFLLSFYESKIIVLPKDKSKEKMNVDDLKNLINGKSSKSGSKSQVHTIDTDEDDELYSSGTKSSKIVVTSSGLKKKDPV